MSVDFWSSLLNTDVLISGKQVCEHCSFVCGCLCRHEQGRHVWQKCTLHHQQTFFYSSLVKRKRTWLHSQGIKFKAGKKEKKNYFCCLHTLAYAHTHIHTHTHTHTHMHACTYTQPPSSNLLPHLLPQNNSQTQINK